MENRTQIILKTSIYGIIMNMFLSTIKLISGILSNSISIILDAVNNLTDAISSIVTIIGLKLSLKEPDLKHPFGHGRIEYIASILIAFIILFAGLTSFKESIIKIINPVIATYTTSTIIILIVSILVKYFFGKYMKKVGTTVNSDSLIASGMDAQLDSILSTAILIGIIINITLNITIDGYLGLLISILIIKSSIEIITDTLNKILGSRTNEELVSNIRTYINSFDKIEGTYDIILHNYGPTKHIGSAHIQVDDNMTANEVHKLTREISVAVYMKFTVELTIGIYASNTNDEKYAKIKESLDKIINKYETVLQMHGFYVDTNNNIITFDIIIDYSIKNKESITNLIIDEITKIYPEFEFHALIDNNFSE